MRSSKCVLILLGLLSMWTSSIVAQIAENSAEVSAAGVGVSVAPIGPTAQSVSSMKLQISITDNTKRILVRAFPEGQGSVEIEVQNQDGAVPPETTIGCKLHMSKECGSSVNLRHPGSLTATVVMPGQTVSFERDIAKEFDLVTTHSLLVQVIARGFVLVDAPESVTEAPPDLRRLLLVNYQQYPYTKLAPFRSKTVRVQVGN